MRILLIGRTGQVGHELDRLLKNPTATDPTGTDPRVGAWTSAKARVGSVPYDALVSLDYPQIDLTDPDSILTTIRRNEPDLIINAAAYTAVDRAEEEEPIARALNTAAPGIMAEEMKRRGGALIHYSTDYVFDGEKTEPYTEDDTPNPLGVYGRTKLAGEEAIAATGVPHITFRTSWIYGPRGKNFLLTILKLAHEREELRIVDDQHGAPTTAEDLARATLGILEGTDAAAKPGTDLPSGPRHGLGAQWDLSPHMRIRNNSGLYHLTNTGHTTWHGFAKAVIEQDPDRAGQTLRSLTPIPTSEYPTPAPRPKNSRLDCTKAKEILGIELPPWDESLARVMTQLGDWRRIAEPEGD